MVPFGPDLARSNCKMAAVLDKLFQLRKRGNGLAAGLVLHPLLKLTTGRIREIHPGTFLLGVACACYYLFGKPH